MILSCAQLLGTSVKHCAGFLASTNTVEQTPAQCDIALEAPFTRDPTLQASCLASCDTIDGDDSTDHDIKSLASIDNCERAKLFKSQPQPGYTSRTPDDSGIVCLSRCTLSAFTCVAVSSQESRARWQRRHTRNSCRIVIQVRCVTHRS